MAGRPAPFRRVAAVFLPVLSVLLFDTRCVRAELDPAPTGPAWSQHRRRSTAWLGDLTFDPSLPVEAASA
jgi:hypothetical protein